MKAKRILALQLALVMALSIPLFPAQAGALKSLTWQNFHLAYGATLANLNAYINYDPAFRALHPGYEDDANRIAYSLRQYYPVNGGSGFAGPGYALTNTKVHSSLTFNPASYARDAWNYSYDMLMSDLGRLESLFGDPQTHPNAYMRDFRVEIIGQSELGRDIPAILLGNDGAASRMLIVAGQQGADWANPLLLMRLIEYWLWNSRLAVIDGEKMSDFWLNTQLCIVPMANPDGVMLGQSGLSSLTPAQQATYGPTLTAAAAADNASRIAGVNADSDWTAPSPGDPPDFTYWDNNVNGVSLLDAFSDATPEGAALIALQEEYAFNLALSLTAAGRRVAYAGARSSDREELAASFASYLGCAFDDSRQPGGFAGWFAGENPQGYAVELALGDTGYYQVTRGTGYNNRFINLPAFDAPPLEAPQVVSSPGAFGVCLFDLIRWMPVYAVQQIHRSGAIAGGGNRIHPLFLAAVNAAGTESEVQAALEQYKTAVFPALSAYDTYHAPGNAALVAQELFFSRPVGGYTDGKALAERCSELVSLSFTETHTQSKQDLAIDGTITLTASGGTPPYSYSVDGGGNWSSSGAFTGLSVNGEYTAVVEDSLGIRSVSKPVSLLIPLTTLNVDALLADAGGNPTTDPWERFPTTGVVNFSKQKYGYLEMMEDIDDLLDLYSPLVQSGWLSVETVGVSSLGRSIPAVVLGNPAAQYSYMALGGSHAREYMSTLYLMTTLEYYLENLDNYFDGVKVSELLDDCRFYFIPMHNPDGVMLSQEGLYSLDEPGLNWSTGGLQLGETREALTVRLIALMLEMNRTVSGNAAERDTDWSWSLPTQSVLTAEGAALDLIAADYDIAAVLAADPGMVTDPVLSPRLIAYYIRHPEKADFTYWKCNINAVDVHYDFYDQQMLDWLEEGTFWHDDSRSLTYRSGYYYMNNMDLENGGVSQPETAAVADYCGSKVFDMSHSIHTLGNIYQWNYGFMRELPYETNGAVRQARHEAISSRLADFTHQELSMGYNAHLGFNGWHLHTFGLGYNANVELAQRDFFTTAQNASLRIANDASPVRIEQFTTDVSLTSGKQNYSIWTKQRFLPLYTVKYMTEHGLIQ